MTAIEELVRRHPEGISMSGLLRALDANVSPRTLQHRLSRLVDRDRLRRQGSGRWVRYLSPLPKSIESSDTDAVIVRLSEAGRGARAYIRQPYGARQPAGYDRAFLDRYQPNTTFYLAGHERDELTAVGRSPIAEQPAGTYAKQILGRLLIDLAWNSSRLEGNTYSLLDTKRLIELDEQASGHGRLEAQMILNHKDAIEFLVSAATEIGFNRYTVLNLHALLANNLLMDSSAAGRLRYIAVGIEGSVFHPLEAPALIEERFDQILATAEAITDPFEQSFFVMVHLPYLQPFDDVNKRVSRLAANIPFIKGNISPLSFADVPRDLYTEAILSVYERADISLLRDVFLWAYRRSAARYAAIRQSLGEPDPFRLRHREIMREVISDLIRRRVDRPDARAHIAERSVAIDPGERPRLIELIENELIALHEGNFARYQVRPSDYAAWRRVWDRRF